MKLWVGDEREGKHKGTYTLFVGSPVVNLDDITFALSKEKNIQQIYFGAGRCTTINQDVVRATIDKFPNLLITLEVDVSDLHKIDQNIFKQNYVELLLTITNKNIKYLKKANPYKTQIKIQALTDDKDMYITLVRMENFCDVNDKELLGKKYKGDRVLLK
jgi:hypothetical protein